MRKENYIIIGLITILGIVLLSIITKNYFTYRNVTIVTKNPFDTIEILGQKVRLKENVKTYDVEIDCTEMAENEQILYYRLNEEYKESIISVSAKVYDDKTIIEENFQNATNIDVNISVFDENKKYEQVFHIKVKCLNNNIEEITEPPEDSKKKDK